MSRDRRSEMALKMNVEAFGRVSRALFLWTLTTPGTESAASVENIWDAFWQVLRGKEGRRGKTLVVIRVLEPHPKGHGWHVHFLTDRWLKVQLIRDIAESVGFGRIHVAPIRKDSAGYVAKYVSKSLGQSHGARRIWSVVGGVSTKEWRVLVKDIAVSSHARTLVGMMRREWGGYWLMSYGPESVYLRVQRVMFVLCLPGYLTPWGYGLADQIPIS